MSPFLQQDLESGEVSVIRTVVGRGGHVWTLARVVKPTPDDKFRAYPPSDLALTSGLIALTHDEAHFVEQQARLY